MMHLPVMMGFILIGLAGHSQDKIVTLNGDTIHCRILDFNSMMLSYKLSSNDSICYTSGSQIYQLLYSDGQIKNVSPRVLISGKDDWEKVLITYDTADVKGLIRIGDLKAKAYSYDNNEERAQNEARKKIKKEAAELGAFIVLITYQDSRGMYTHVVIRYNNSKAIYKAVAYTYKK